jgi:hypothetical protein
MIIENTVLLSKVQNFNVCADLRWMRACAVPSMTEGVFNSQSITQGDTQKDILS